jgi:hypothetical protein
MNQKKIFVLILFLITLFLINSCCNCGTDTESYLNGKIVVVGNEPFVELYFFYE